MTADMNETTAARRSMATKLLFGIFLAALGLILAGDNLDLIEGDELLRYWSVILIVLGAVKLFQPGHGALAVLLIAAGTWILAYNLGWFPFTLFDLWPLILIGIGFGMISRSFRNSAPTPVQPAGNQDHAMAILATRRIAPAGAWRGGRFGAFLGNCEIDLTATELGPEPAVIEVMAFWGAVVVTVPDGCEVLGDVVPIMAGFESKIGAATEPKRRVLVQGMALMGGVEVKNGKARAR